MLGLGGQCETDDCDDGGQQASAVRLIVQPASVVVLPPTPVAASGESPVCGSQPIPSGLTQR